MLQKILRGGGGMQIGFIIFALLLGQARADVE